MPNLIKIDSAIAALRMREKTRFRVGFFVYVYICIYLSIYLYIRSLPRLQATFFSAILMLNGSYDVFLQPLVSFGGRDEIAPHLGGQIPQKPPFWDMKRRFQAKLVKSKNMHIIKTTASIPTRFCTVIKTTKCPSWVVRTAAILEKSKDRHISAAV